MRRSTATMAATATLAILIFGAGAPAQAATTYEVTPIAPDSAYAVQGNLAESDGLLYVPGSVGASATTLWRADPAAGTAVPLATAQNGEFQQVQLVAAAGGVVFFVGQPEPVPGPSRVYRYDPATDVATPYPALPSPVLELVAVGDVPYISDGSQLYTLDPDDPAAAPVAVTPAPCVDGTAYTAVADLSALVDGVAFSGSCGAGSTGELFVVDGGVMTNLYAGAVVPAGADIVGPDDMTELLGALFFSAGREANERHLFRYEPATATITAVDPTTTYPGRTFLFEGRVTWLAQDAAQQSVIEQWEGGSPTRLPISSYGEFETPLQAVAWGGRLLLDGFYDNVGGGDAAAFAFDPVDGAFVRLGSGGAAFVPPYVATDGIGYVVETNGDPDAAVILRVDAAAPPAPPAPPAPVLPVTGVDLGPLVAGTAVAVVLVAGGVVLLVRRRTARRP